jgi:putative endopeptidase
LILFTPLSTTTADEWPDFTFFKSTGNEISSSNHLSNIFAAHRYDHQTDMQRVNAPTDKNRWFMSPQTVNAYYHPSMNLICFPAAILQAPFFDAEADMAVNYGGMGAVVGHEMTHGFDDQGSKYDHKGNLQNWWSDEDKLNYEKRVEVIVKQADEFKVHGLNMKGKLTAGENLADLGGLRLSLRALKKELGGPEAINKIDKIDGFTPIQRFFLSWATVWRQNVTEERSKQLLTIDPHAANEFRANGPLANMGEFHEAFGVKEGDVMFKKEEERVDVW